VELVETPDATEIDDEIKDTIVVASPTASDRSSSNTGSFIGKATLSDSTSSPAGHLLTPDRTLEPDNNASSTSAPPVSMVIDSFLATPPISADFNA
jgi:hypothetical protein